MSPGQAVGKPPDRGSDIFSFGAVLYGQAPASPARGLPWTAAALDCPPPCLPLPRWRSRRRRNPTPLMVTTETRSGGLVTG